MSRAEAIQRIVWCLLCHIDQPESAVATAQTLQKYLGEGYEQQMTFTNLLRAAGIFAKDDDGYFIRYRYTDEPTDELLLHIPQANYLLTLAVPTEPRMRIAYSVFTGLLLKYIYQTYGAVPIEASEGLARLFAKQPLPDTDTLWAEFKQSGFVARALCEGLDATLGAIDRGIGRIDVTETMAESVLLDAFFTVLPRFSRKFQTQGGLRLVFYFTKDIDEWLAQHDGANASNESIAELWQHGLQEGISSHEIARRIAIRIVREVDRRQPLRTQTFKGLWTGERSKPGERDGWLRAARENVVRNKETDGTLKEVDEAVPELLSQLDAEHRDTRELHQWVNSELGTEQWKALLENIVVAIQRASMDKDTCKSETFDFTPQLDSIKSVFQSKAIIPSLSRKVSVHNREVGSAIQQTVKLCIAKRLAEKLNQTALVSIFGWRVATLRRVPSKHEWVIRFLKKSKPEGGKRIVEIRPFGNIERLAEKEADIHYTPFQCLNLSSESSLLTSQPLLSGQRCIVCGSQLDLLAGAKSFLPEAKKRHYETPTREEAPSLCSNCAFIAYLSSVYPSSDLSVVEFPADNFLELFALYESLQGISALIAMKYVNRVASLSVLPSRYMLLSHNNCRGRMDAKAQIYLQLSEQTHLLKYIHRPMRVQIEGSIPQMWSEIQPYVPIGLSYFKELPPYYETQDSARKGFAYEVVRCLQTGQPYKALYVAAKHSESSEYMSERRVFTKNLKAYETFVSEYRQALAKSLGGETMSDDIYQDIADFSNYLFDLLHPLVRREVQKSGSSVSGIARKYTDLILREFSEGLAGKFLYTVCQEADSAERDGEGWVKHKAFTTLYGGSPDIKGKEPKSEDFARAWDDFRKSHPVKLESRLQEYHCKFGTQYALWQKYLREVQARTLALLMLNVRRSS